MDYSASPTRLPAIKKERMSTVNEIINFIVFFDFATDHHQWIRNDILNPGLTFHIVLDLAPLPKKKPLKGNLRIY
jgi:hypothetical protein